MLRPTLAALLLVLVLVGLAVPASAGDVTVDAVVAAQYSFGLFVAFVVAHGTADLVDAQLVVNGTTAIVPDKVQEYSLDGPKNGTLWKFVKYANSVVAPGDSLTGIVMDIDGSTGQKTVACGAGFPRLRQTALCR